MRNRLRKIYGVIFAVVFLYAVMIGGLAFAQEKYPTKPITIIVPWAAGGSVDLTARALQPSAEKILGQPIIVMNKPGGSGTIAFGSVMESTPDGYTLVITGAGLSIVKYTVLKTGVDYVKFEPIIYLGHAPLGLFVRKDAKWNTIKDFFNYAKSNPGKASVGNAAYGGSHHIMAIAIERAAGVKFLHVPYKGTAPAIVDLLGGHVDAIVGGLLDTFAQIKADKMRPLAVTPDRSSLVPGVPSFKEVGADINFRTWLAILGPKGLPKERLNILYNAFKKSTETKEFKDFFESAAATVYVQGPEELGKFLQEEDKMYKELVTIGGIKPE